MDRLVTKKEVALFMFFSSLYYFLFTYKSFNNYFYFDDLDTLSWIHLVPTFDFIKDTFNFNFFNMPSFYRPSGSLLHSICFKLFGLNFFPYHVVATLIHLFNLGCLYLLISKLVPSKSAVLLGTFIFTFHLTTMPIYWYFFGTFDSLSAAFLLLSFLFYIKHSRKFNFWYLLSLLCFVIALRSKEMPLSFPPILLCYEILISRTNETKDGLFKRILRALWPFFTISIAAGLLKFSATITVDKTSAYSIHFDWISLIGGFHHFVSSSLYEMRIPLYGALILLVILGLVAILLKSKTLAFAYLFIIVSLFPILPLANRRADYHMYIPLIGVSIYIAVLFQCLQEISRKAGGRFIQHLYVFVIALVILHSYRNWQLKSIIEERYLDIANENREFVKLIAPHRTGPGTIYLYDSTPKALPFESAVFAVVNLLFHDTSATTKAIPDCTRDIPPPIDHDVCCISFRNRTVRIWPATIRKR